MSRQRLRLTVLVAGAAVALLPVVPAAAGTVGKPVGTITIADCQKLGPLGPATPTKNLDKGPQSNSGIETAVSDFVGKATVGEQQYSPPNSLQVKAFQCGWLYANLAKYSESTAWLRRLLYDVNVYNLGQPTEFAVLAEQECNSVTQRDGEEFGVCTGKEKYPRGWGLYVIRKQRPLPLVAVEVPHPCATPSLCASGGANQPISGDAQSHVVGAKTFNGAKAGFLGIAGTRRNANKATGTEDFSCTSSTQCGCVDYDRCADMAHQDFSIFEAVHEMIIVKSAPVHILQPHAFGEGNHPKCQEVVVSGAAAPTSSNPTGLAQKIRDELANDQNVKYTNKVLVYGKPEWTACNFGSARNNEQAVTTNQNNREFISVEMGSTVLADPASVTTLSQTVATIISS